MYVGLRDLWIGLTEQIEQDRKLKEVYIMEESIM